MRYRQLGLTDLHVSVIGFGASPLGNVFGEMSLSAAEKAVMTAIDQGINLFDVSPYYGDTLAEQRLGGALASRRKEVFIATKCGRYGVDTFDFSATTITRNFDESLRRLRTDYVDLLQAHDVEFGIASQIIDETLPAMQRLKEQGKVRCIGITGYWPGQLARLVRHTDVECVLNYCHANLFVNDMNDELVPVIEQRGVGLLNASPLHMGLLGDRPVPPWHPAPQSVQHAAREVRSACHSFGVDPATYALQICLGLSSVSSTLVGISSPEEVLSACLALDWTPPAELIQRIQAIVEPVRNIVWPSGLEQSQEGFVTSS